MHALSVDLEDWYHADLVQASLGREARRALIVEATEALLALFRRRGSRATFFVLGEVALEHPSLLRRIESEGHELACHGMTHERLHGLDRESFSGQLDMFADAVRAACGPIRIMGFRAPSFSLDKRTGWSLEVLADRGYLYDSSVFPMRTPLYGVRGAPLGAYRPSVAHPGRGDPDQSLVELPVTVAGIGPLRVPVGGGAYLRVLPMAVLRPLWRRVARCRPLVVYVHPWEAHAATPRVGMSRAAAWFTYHNCDGALPRLDELLAAYRFDSMAAVLGLRAAAAFGRSGSLRR